MISNRTRRKYNAASERRKKKMAVNFIRQEVGCVSLRHPFHTAELSAESLKKIYDMRNKALDLCNIPQLTEITLDFKATSSTISLDNSVGN